MNISFIANTTARGHIIPKVPLLNCPDDLFSLPEEAAHEAIEQILFEGSLIIEEKLFDKRANPFSVNYVVKTLVSLVENKYIRQDTFNDSPLIEPVEPIPSPIDSWSRNVIPVVRKFKLATRVEQSHLTLASKSKKTIKSRSSALSFIKRNNYLPKPHIDSETIQEEPTLIPNYNPLPEVNEEVEHARQQKEQKIMKKKKKSEEQKRQIKAEIDLETRILKEEEKFKGKGVTYDCKGNVMMVNPIGFTSLFQETQPVKLIPEAPNQNLKINVKARVPRKALSTPKKQKYLHYDQEWIKNVGFKAASILEHISPNSNVTIIDKHRTIYPPKPLDNLTMSRKQYLLSVTPKKQELESSFAQDKKSISFSSLKSGLVKDNESKISYFENLPDYEENPGTLFTEQNSPKSVSPVNSKGFGRIIHYATENKINLVRPVDRFNLEILENQRWGVNPPLARPTIVSRVPHKLNLKEMREIYGNIVKKPKDCPFMTVEELWREKSEIIKKPKDRPYVDKIIKKSKAPIPPLGQSMVHILSNMK